MPDLPVANGKGYDDGEDGGEPDQHGQRNLKIDLFFAREHGGGDGLVELK